MLLAIGSKHKSKEYSVFYLDFRESLVVETELINQSGI